MSIRRNRIITDEECLPILSNPLDPGAKAYLSAIRAVAIYVSIDYGKPTSVGATLDLEKALRHIQKSISPSVRFGWIAWASSFPAAAAIAQTPDILTQRQDDGVKVAAPLRGGRKAYRDDCRNPPARNYRRTIVFSNARKSTRAISSKRSRNYSRAERWRSSTKPIRRIGSSSSGAGKRLRQIWAVLEDLRAVIVRSLIANACSSVLALVEIRKAFPWFTRSNLTSLKN